VPWAATLNETPVLGGGTNAKLYRRMLEKLAGSARLADDLRYFACAHTEHHL
jgi:hypothetical protein